MHVITRHTRRSRRSPRQRQRPKSRRHRNTRRRVQRRTISERHPSRPVTRGMKISSARPRLCTDLQSIRLTRSQSTPCIRVGKSRGGWRGATGRLTKPNLIPVGTRDSIPSHTRLTPGQKRHRHIRRCRQLMGRPRLRHSNQQRPQQRQNQGRRNTDPKPKPTRPYPAGGGVLRKRGTLLRSTALTVPSLLSPLLLILSPHMRTPPKMVITNRTLHQPPNTRNPKPKIFQRSTTAPQQPTASNTPNEPIQRVVG